jgi:nitroreductase
MDEGNPVIAAIRARRSVRKYRHGTIHPETLETIVDCGRLAPTANNMQAWEFVVVTDPDKLAALANLATHGPFIRDAAACIVLLGDPVNRSVYLDGAAATENMLLAIHSLGLASCWVQGYEKEYNPEVLRLLNAPDHLVLVSLIPVGFPTGESRVPRKRPLAEVLHWETY